MPEGPGTGMASVPLRKAQGKPFGALTVVTATPGEPTAGQRDALRAVARWAAGQLRLAEPHALRPEAPPVGPEVAGGARLPRGAGGGGGGAAGREIGPG